MTQRISTSCLLQGALAVLLLFGCGDCDDASSHLDASGPEQDGSGEMPCETNCLDGSVEDPDSGNDAGVMHDAAIEDASMDDATLQDATMEDATLQDATMEDATMEDATMEDADTEDADIEDGGSDAGDPPDDQVVVCRELSPLLSGETCEVTAGNDRKLITGDILLPRSVLQGGQVLVDELGIIVCAACDCSAQASGATQILCPTGVVSPGLINAHDHLTFAHNSPAVRTAERYEQRDDWRLGQGEHTALAVPGGASQDQLRWGELRFVMSGATSSVSAGSVAGFVRNLDSTNNDLDLPPVRIETFPLDDSGGGQRVGDCNYGGNPDTAASIAGSRAYVAHVAEGIDAQSRNQFLCMASTTFDTMVPGVSDDLVIDRAAFVHAVGLTASDYAQMARDGTALIWSPRSNVSLYGDTAAVTAAATQGVLIALSTDWVLTGSMNMARELVCADQLNTEQYAGFFSDKELWEMVTLNPALATATDQVLGSLTQHRIADIAIFEGGTRALHRAVIAAEPQDVTLVMRGGEVLYGDSAVVDAVAGTGACDVLEVCGVTKRVCAQAEIDKSLAELQISVGSTYNAFFCGTPPSEPSCVPTRSNTPTFPDGSVDGSSLYTGISSASDHDGDGIANASDNCPDIFNPIRPLDSSMQADADGDNMGDACDICPLDADSTTCAVFDPLDFDDDGVLSPEDNCAANANADQADDDDDRHGDVCDACPSDPNPGEQGCPVPIYAIKDGTEPIGTLVRVLDALVTGKSGSGFFIQVKETDADYFGEDFSGIFVLTSNSTMAVGNRVDVEGVVSTFLGQIQLGSVVAIEITSAAVEAAPAPIVATVADLTTSGTRATALEGVLVEVASATVTAPFNGFNEFTITDASAATMLVDDFLYLTTPPPAASDTFAPLRGILALRTIGGGQAASKIHPRGAGDLVDGDQTADLVDLIPASYVVAASGTVDFEVGVDLPAPAGGLVVNLVVSPAIAGSVPATVTILEGMTSAAFTYTDGGAASSATISATLGAVTLDVGLTGVTSGGALFISEYLEGSSMNKAIELMNPLLTPFDLGASACAVHFYFNGNPTATAQVPLTGSIAGGDVFVLCHGSAAMAVLNVCDQMSNSVNHNGDDVVELRCNGATFDAIGQIGVDPGTAWGVSPISTANNTLRRRCGVTSGDTNASDPFDPATSGWAGFAQDTLDGLSSPSCVP